MIVHCWSQSNTKKKESHAFRPQLIPDIIRDVQNSFRQGQAMSRQHHRMPGFLSRQRSGRECDPQGSDCPAALQATQNASAQWISLDVGRFKSDLGELKLKTVLIICLPQEYPNNLTTENFLSELRSDKPPGGAAPTHQWIVLIVGATPSRWAGVLQR